MRCSGSYRRGFIFSLTVVPAFATIARAEVSVPSDTEINALIEQLGSEEYAAREAAAVRLDAIGAAAIDSLLAAAESSPDLEVALRARWLAESIPLTTPADLPHVTELLEKYRRKSFGERVVIMHRLLRVDDDAGVNGLARIVRLDRDPTAARIAAAILVREWIPDDPYWPGMADRILVGLGGSRRPAAEFVRTVVRFSRAASAAERATLARDGVNLLPLLDRLGTAPQGPGGRSAASADAVAAVTSTSQLICERAVIDMLVQAGLREEAMAVAEKQLADRTTALTSHDIEDAEDAAGKIADILVWSSSHGVTDVVDSISPATDEAVRRKPILYAAAVCERARGHEAEASQLAQSAFETANKDFSERVQAAMLLVKWGIGDWASREYAAIIDDPATPAGQHAFAAVLYSEFLHDQGRDGEAAATLRPIVDGAGDDAAKLSALQQIGRDPLTVRARMHYFEACAAAARGDAPGQRKALAEATSTIAKDVDALIALYELPDDSAEHRTEVRRLIDAALERIKGGIEAAPDDTTSYNEYAWLVANTEGDVAKATRYSRHTLAESPDNSSYLDTLAHCYAAAKNYPLAIRTQRLAQRLEPHNRIIRLNLEKFERRAARADAATDAQ